MFARSLIFTRPEVRKFIGSADNDRIRWISCLLLSRPKKQCIKAGAMLQNGREKMLGNDQAGLPDGIVSNQKYQFEYVNIAVFCNERYW
jgi:hypothetical protein